jgi:uroporphyrinogen-III synthase
MLLINTRPSDRAASLTQTLENARIPVIELPLLELVEQPYGHGLAGLFAQLPRTNIIVVVSPTAAQIGMRYLQQAGLSLEDLGGVYWVAVGKATEQALAGYGIQSHVPTVETSEGMLQLPVLQQLPAGSTVAFWRGEGGRQFMMRHLQAQQTQILNFILYDRHCPPVACKILAEHLAQLEAAPLYAVLISSEASWLNWLNLIQPYPHLRDRAFYLVLGPRLAAILRQYQQQHQAGFQFTQLDDLSGSTILQQIQMY